MDFLDYLTPFMGTETAFAFLFMALFFYFIKTTKEREQQHQDLVRKELQQLSEDLKILIEVWRILLEKELEAKRNGNSKP